MASFAGSTEGSGKSRGLVRRAFAFRAVSGGANGSGAPSIGRLFACVASLALLASLALASVAGAAAPTVTIEGASDVGLTGAKFKGKVNPNGKETSWRFEYISDEAFQAKIDAKQTVHVAAGSGAYKLSFKGQSTGEIAFNATASQLETALNALSSIGGAGGSVAVTGGPGDPFETNPYKLTFGGTLAETEVEPLGFEPTSLSGFGYVEVNQPGHAVGFGGAAQAGGDPLNGGEVPVEAMVGGLSAGKTYHLRLVASNADGAADAVAANFATDPATAPALNLDSATASYTTAHLSGTIDPEGGSSDANGPAPIRWELQYSTNPGTNGWSQAAEGTISGAQAESTAAIPVEANLSGLPPKTKYFYRLVAQYAGLSAQTAEPNPSFETLEVAKPTISLDTPGPVTATTAKFTGHIDPNAPGGNPPAFDVKWRFECTPACPGLAPETTIPADNVEHTFSETTSGLLPGVSYEVTLFASNAAGQVTASKTFVTPVIAPTVKTGSATVTSTSAGIAGSINPNGGTTSYHFEYGETAAYGLSTPAASLPASNEVSSVTANLTGLAPGTTYHFRLVASNSADGANGDDKTFTTAGSGGGACPNAAVREQQKVGFLPECRAYEIVNNPSDEIGDVSRVAGISEDGSAAAFVTTTAGAEANQNTLVSISAGHRSAAGWNVQGIDFRPTSAGGPGETKLVLPVTISSDFNRALYYSNITADPDIVGQSQKFYRSEAGGKATWISRGVNVFIATSVGASKDLGRVVWFNNLGQVAGSGLFVTTNGFDNEPVTVLPDDTVVEGYPAGQEMTSGYPAYWGSAGAALAHRGTRPVSADGRRAYFITGNPNTSSSVHGIYMRDTIAKQTVPVTASQRTGEVGVIKEGAFVSASEDGEIVWFYSGSQLTDDPSPGGGIYRFNVVTKVLTLLTPSVDAAGLQLSPAAFTSPAAQLSLDGSHLYFKSPRVLASGAQEGGNNVYVTSGGSTRLVTATSASLGRVSANGRYLLMTSAASIDGAPNNGHEAVYEYDDVTKDIACVSCRPDGSPSGNDSSLEASSFGFPVGIVVPRNITDDGRVFFNSRDQLIEADLTSSLDVYMYDGGAVSLITPGNTDKDSYIGDNTDDGDDAFVMTRSNLVPQDEDVQELDVYDVRVGGGFLQPPNLPVCEGEACRGASSKAPGAVAPVTSSFIGAGNKQSGRNQGKKHKKHHKKKQHKKKNKKGKGKQKRANGNGRTGR
jgi:hypothetical protein